MKLTICDKCGAVINNPRDLSNTATISETNYDLCDSCVDSLMRSMKLDKEESRQSIIDTINLKSRTESLKEMVGGNK